MKDMKPCQHTLSDDAIYKDVVVIGNGPSGLVTSYMLAGNVPYLKAIPDDLPMDDMLRARLSNIPKDQSLYEADLYELAEGLEGRSQNPIPILMDQLLRPCTDLGYNADSLIEWRYDAEKQVEHIVLGRGRPGGSWHTFPRGVRTLSPAGWLALPPHRAVRGRPGDEGVGGGGERVPASAVAAYCERYVHSCQLQRYIRSGVVVSSVTLAARPAEACACPTCPRNAQYCVAGYDVNLGRPFRVLCSKVIVASGGSERPNTLPTLADYAIHSLAHAETAIKLLAERKVDNTNSVLVVGSGVSAADGIRACMRRCVRAVHVHTTPAAALTQLSPAQHPDYCQVYNMMLDGQRGKYPYYESYPSHVIADVTLLQENDKKTDPLCLKKIKLINLATNEVSEVNVNVILVLIGSKPDLFFLQTNFNLNCIQIEDKCKCDKNKPSKRKIEEKLDENRCFFKNHWSYLKSVIDSCKSKYISSEINGNVYDCRKFDKNDSCDCKCDVIPYASEIESKINCTCQPSNPYSNGIGFGLDPNKAVDCRLNPVAVDKRTHEFLNAPTGLYALGPLTADNFIRFIPGGALAIVSHIHKEKKTLNE